MKKLKNIFILIIILIVLGDIYLKYKGYSNKETQISKETYSENLTVENISDINAIGPEDNNNPIETKEIKDNNKKSETPAPADKKDSNEIINISELSQEFMDEYFDGVEKLEKNNNKSNILIVSSLKDEINTYGAADVVKAPNNQIILQYEDEESKELALRNFKESNEIKCVDENGKYEIENTTYNSWGIEKLEVNTAINVSNSRNLNDVVVAVIDTGCDVNLVEKYYEGKIIEKYNVLENSTNIMTDEVGHGTHVIGTIAEGTPDNVKIMPVKVSSTREIDDVNIIAAINYITYNENANVINMSFGGYANNNAIKTAIDAANEKNIICVAAAGNSNSSATNYPSGYESTISIASVDETLRKSSFSNYGDTITFTAPGTNIKSLMSNSMELASSKKESDDADHGTISGTSMATPYAVSAVAILKSYNINLDLDDTITLLKRHSIDLGRDGKDKYYGYGLITFVNAQFCEEGSDDHDEYNVFKHSDPSIESLPISKIEHNNSSGTTYIPYNYGSITNLMNISIKIYFNENFYIVKQVFDLDGIIIDNYDSNIFYNDETSEGMQEVTLNYRGLSININVATYNNNGWQYEIIDENSIKITGTAKYTFCPKIIYIPETIDGYTVTELGDNLFRLNLGAPDDKELFKIFLPSTITSIGENAFSDRYTLETVELSDSLVTIGNNAFKNTNIESITLPDTLESIGDSAFENTKITELNIPENVNSIGDCAFGGCNNIISLTVDENNLSYNDGNDNNCIIETASNTLIKGNYDTVIPNNVVCIGEYAFYNDDRIEEIVISNSVTSIGWGAFKYESNIIESKLKKVFIPSSVNSMDYPFNSKEKNITLYIDSNNYVRFYAIQNKLSYEIMNNDGAYATLLKYNYSAFEQAEGQLYITCYYEYGYYNYDSYYSNKQRTQVIYNDDISNYQDSNLIISYQNGDSFRYGDQYLIVQGKDIYGKDFQANCMVTISKADPTYTVPSNIKARVGQTLSEVKLPDNFAWENDEQVLEETGEQTFYANYIPDDTNNYNIIENIEIKIIVREAFPDLLKGDYNKDGNITLYDAFTILRIVILGDNDLNDEEIYIMDYNDDENVTLYDAFSFLKQAIMGN